MHSRKRLLSLFDEVKERSATLAEARPTWPCHRGCDQCCRRLARVPEITRTEWELLSSTLHALSAETQAEVRSRARALVGRADTSGEGPVECPFLEREQGACLVYAGRPLACRTYGFYRARAHDVFCTIVEAHVADEPQALVFGNHEAAERALKAIDSETRSVLAWLDGN